MSSSEFKGRLKVRWKKRLRENVCEKHFLMEELVEGAEGLVYGIDSL